MQDDAHMRTVLCLSQAMVGKKKEGVERVYRMHYNGMDLWDAYEACKKRKLDVGTRGNVQRGYTGWLNARELDVEEQTAAMQTRAHKTPSKKPASKKQPSTSTRGGEAIATQALRTSHQVQVGRSIPIVPPIIPSIIPPTIPPTIPSTPPPPPSPSSPPPPVIQQRCAGRRHLASSPHLPPPGAHQWGGGYGRTRRIRLSCTGLELCVRRPSRVQLSRDRVGGVGLSRGLCAVWTSACRC